MSRFFTTDNGELFVTTIGTILMLKLCVECWVSLLVKVPPQENMAVGQELSGLMTSDVLGVKHLFFSAEKEGGDNTIVITQMVLQ